MKIKSLIFVVLVIFSGLAYAKPLKRMLGSWIGAAYKNPFSATSKWSYAIKGQLRLLDRSEVYQQTLLDGGVFYKASSNWKLGGGYRFFHDNPLAKPDVNEHRIYESVMWSTKFSEDREAISFNTQLEERFRESQNKMSLRLREKGAWNHVVSQKLTFVLSDEVFVGLVRPTWAGPSAFDQNRLFLGFSRSLGSRSKVVFGYLNQYLDRNPKNIMNHILFVMFKF